MNKVFVVVYAYSFWIFSLPSWGQPSGASTTVEPRVEDAKIITKTNKDSFCCSTWKNIAYFHFWEEMPQHRCLPDPGPHCSSGHMITTRWHGFSRRVQRERSQCMRSRFPGNKIDFFIDQTTDLDWSTSCLPFLMCILVLLQNRGMRPSAVSSLVVSIKLECLE